jgi:hypothetical protein
MGRRSRWEKVPERQSAYNPMLKRIQFLAEQGLTSLMMLFDFLSRRITPFQQHVHAAWLYTGENDTT